MPAVVPPTSPTAPTQSGETAMQGLHQDYRILCALGVVYGPGADTAWSPRAPERFSDAATARANAVLALASADRGPLSRLPEVVVHHVLGFAIALFK